MPTDTSLTLQDQLIVFLMCAVWALAITGLAATFRFFLVPADQEKISSEVTLWEVVITFAVFLTLSVLIAPMLALLWVSWHEGQWFSMEQITARPILTAQANIIALFFIGFGMLGYFALLPKRIQKSVWKNALPFFKNIRFGVITWIVSYPWILVISVGIAILLSWLGIPPVEEEQTAVQMLKNAAGNRGILLLMGLMLVTTVPMVEEMLFRGFLQNWLKRVFGITISLILTSLVFAFFHFSVSQGIKNLELLLSLFVLSCFLGFIYERQQSLWAPIGLHATFNALSVIAILYDL